MSPVVEIRAAGIVANDTAVAVAIGHIKVSVVRIDCHRGWLAKVTHCGAGFETFSECQHRLAVLARIGIERELEHLMQSDIGQPDRFACCVDSQSMGHVEKASAPVVDYLLRLWFDGDNGR